MIIIELLQQLIDAQVVTQPSLTCLSCTGKSYSAVAAALATEGYYLQADILDQIFFHGMDNWTILLYVCAAIGGLVSAAMGMPPKTYLWFFMGPAVYHWLVGNTTTSFGVHWTVGWEGRDQREVWKLARPGLTASNYITKYGIRVDNGGPRAPAEVADLFAWFDDVVSDTVHQLVTWTGVAYMERRYVGPTMFASTWLGIGGGGLGGGGLLGGTMSQADLISGMKWTYLNNIVDARITNMYLRDAWGIFLGGTCGQIVRDMIDGNKLSHFANARGRNLSAFDTLFKNGLAGGLGVPTHATELQARMSQRTWPTDDINRTLLADQSFVVDAGLVPLQLMLAVQSTMTCGQYFDIVMSGMRLEAYRIAQQMVMNRPHPDQMAPADFVMAMFQGWDVPGLVPGIGAATNLEAHQYLTNLILIHLIRNELMLTSKGIGELKYLPSDMIEKKMTRDSTRGPASRQKYSELYTWALMVPWFQGLLFYLLAGAYPFACMLSVVPGWHKAIFTWMSFWLWAKLWDLGFAIVMLAERSIWAGLGNSTDMGTFNDVTRLMAISNLMVPDTTGTGFILPVAVPFLQNFTIFDKAILLAFNTEFDLANTFYVYIMSALYFAVPAVFGQLVLGAKAGLGNMLTQPMGQIADAASRNVGNAWQDVHQRAALEQKVLGQYAFKMGKAMEEGSLFTAAMQAQNEKFDANMRGTGDQQVAKGMQQALASLGARKDLAQSYADYAWGLVNTMRGGMSTANDAMGAKPPTGTLPGPLTAGAPGAASPSASTIGAPSSVQGNGSLPPTPVRAEDNPALQALKGIGASQINAPTGVSQGAKGSLAQFIGMADSLGDYVGIANPAINSGFKLDMNRDYQNASVAVGGATHGLGNSATGHDMRGRLLDSAGDRYQAGFNAQTDMDAWRFARDTGNHVGPTLAAWGTFAGTAAASDLQFNAVGATYAFASGTKAGQASRYFHGGDASAAGNVVAAEKGRFWDSDKVMSTYSGGWNEAFAKPQDSGLGVGEVFGEIGLSVLPEAAPGGGGSVMTKPSK